ncbi:unnamed protein product [Mytilus edulis]|uniref:C1q domain-containing protein n=1 Tax=Mytilus edulis TaxID=6550 RepID=A0A8S3QXQ4_MYTED|nr:unnamed protein product [Mytilus edulis]
MRNNLTVTHLEGKCKEMNNKLITNEANYNVSIVEILNKLDKTGKESNSSIALLEKQIDEKVALTSHPLSRSIVKGGNIIKFNSVAFSVGINNLSAFISSGKFVFETPGLYLISASLPVYQSGNPEFHIVLNGLYISSTEIGQTSVNSWRSGTSVVARQLVVNDSVWVQAAGDILFGGNKWDQFTIIKIN